MHQEFYIVNIDSDVDIKRIIKEFNRLQQFLIERNFSDIIVKWDNL